MDDPYAGPKRIVGQTLVLLCVLIAALVVTGLLLIPRARTVPPGLEPAPAPSTFVLTAEETTDPHQVGVTIQLGPATSANAWAGGTITALSCVVGGSIDSGSSPLGINGAALLALHTVVPLWRDLARGDEGADVVALQGELNRLGLGAGDSGVFDTATLNAVKAAARNAGVAEPRTSLSRSGLVWLPFPRVAIASCPVAVGQEIGYGAAFANLAPQITAIRVGGDRTRDVPGARLLQIGEATVAVADDATINAADQEILANTVQVRLYQLNPDMVLTGEYRLAEPITVYPVPPGAVKAVNQLAGCVLTTTGAAVPVELLGSSLGRTYLRFDQAAPSEIVLAPPADLTCT